MELRVGLGKRYVLESSPDLSQWTATSEAFIADNETLIREFDAGSVGRYFRIVEKP